MHTFIQLYLHGTYNYIMSQVTSAACTLRPEWFCIHGAYVIGSDCSFMLKFKTLVIPCPRHTIPLSGEEAVSSVSSQLAYS